MVIRRCPQCHSTGDDIYGFCIKCGYEYPKIENNQNMCPFCGYTNPDEAEYCVKCGSPLIFKNQFENNQIQQINPVIIKSESQNTPHTSRVIIVLGYIFSILGGLIGLIIALYLVTRKDPVARKHGIIQLGILIFYIALIAILFLSGAIPQDVLMQYQQLTGVNLTSLNL